MPEISFHTTYSDKQYLLARAENGSESGLQRRGCYRFGFNGQEMDNEISGLTGTHTTAEFWEYDARLGRRWNVDPINKVSGSDYSCFSGNPIYYVDPDGLTPEKTGDKRFRWWANILRIWPKWWGPKGKARFERWARCNDIAIYKNKNHFGRWHKKNHKKRLEINWPKIDLPNIDLASVRILITTVTKYKTSWRRVSDGIDDIWNDPHIKTYPINPAAKAIIKFNSYAVPDQLTATGDGTGSQTTGIVANINFLFVPAGNSTITITVQPNSGENTVYNYKIWIQSPIMKQITCDYLFGFIPLLWTRTVQKIPLTPNASPSVTKRYITLF